MVVPALMESNEIKEIKLREYLGKYVAILFYPADFTQLPRNEILELVDNHEKLRERGCQVNPLIAQKKSRNLACSRRLF